MKGMVDMAFDVIKIEHTGNGYRVMIDGKPYYCEGIAELIEFLEDIDV